MQNNLCTKCGKTLEKDEIGLYKKLFNRGATSFWCKKCVSEYLDVETQVLDKKIIEFKNMGCTLFE